jgi:adenine-specific DNA-methyltransferase
MELDETISHTMSQAQQRQQSYFSTEIDKLDLREEVLKNGLELRIKELEAAIKEAKKASRLALTLEDELVFQKQVKDLETERNQARKRLFESQDEIDAKRDEIIADIEGQLEVQESWQGVITCAWRIDE